MLPLTPTIRIILGVVAATAGILAGVLGQAIWSNIVYRITKRGRKPNPRPLRLWVAFYLSVAVAVVLGTFVSVAPQPEGPLVVLVTLTPTATSTVTPSPTLTPTPAIFSQPTIAQVVIGDLPGYSKQTSMVRSSEGKLTLFVRYENGDLAYLESLDGGKDWSTPTVFDTIPEGPQVSAAIDSADRIHVAWGLWRAGDVKYGLLDNSRWVMTDTIGTGAFARDIAVDSANHPHIVWTNVDLFHITYTGQKWIGPNKVVSGAWHPDIQIDANDNLWLFMNSGGFYPTPGVSVYVMNNIGGQWNKPVKVSKSPFWSGGAAAAFDSRGDIYLVWVGAPSKDGGSDQVFFTRYVGGEWQDPFPIGDVNWAATSTGQESPAVAFDANDVFYVFWRGLNKKNRPVIFARALATENSLVTGVTWGWSPIIELDDPNASDVWWPSVADVRPKSRVAGVDVVWRATIGKKAIIEYSHVSYP